MGSYPNTHTIGKLKTRNRPQEDNMQTIQPQLPEVGKTYISQEDPTLSLYVADVDTIEQDAYGGAGFMATCSSPKDRGNENARYCELFEDDWASLRFIQVAI